MPLVNMLKILRPQFWFLSVIPGLLGIYNSTGTIALKEGVLVAIVLVALSGLAELVNEFVDQDLKKTRKLKKMGPIILASGSGGIPPTGITRNEVIRWCVFLTLVVIVSTLSINIVTFIFAFIGLLLGLGYSVNPIRFKSRGIWGQIVVAVCRGIISYHVGWIAFSPISYRSILISTFISLLVFATTTVANLVDYNDDKKENILTFPVVFGFNRAAHWASLLLWFSVVYLLVLFLFPLTKPNLGLVPVSLLCIFIALSLRHASKYHLDMLLRLQLLGIVLAIISPLVFI